MKKRILLLGFAVALIAGCRKNDKTQELPKEDFFQLQKIESEDGTVTFSYNDKHQLTKIEQLEYAADGVTLKPYQYTNFTFENQLIRKADYFQRSGSNFYKRTEYKYHQDAQKRIAYVSRTFFFPDGGTDKKDTIRYTFNADNKLIKVEFNDENIHEYAYDDRGNYLPDDLQEINDNEVNTYSYDFRYDNKPNPFAAKGLGLYVFSVYFDEQFLLNQLLSASNPVYAKFTIGHKVLGENNMPVYSEENSYASEFANTFDELGTIKRAGITNTYQRKENGNIVDGYTEDAEIKFTCIKKR